MSSTISIFIYFTGGLLFVVLSLLVSRLLRPHRPNPEKLASYESGEEPQGLAWVQISPRFYVLAIIFLLFEVEVVFLFPWAAVFADKQLNAETNHVWGWFSFVEMVVFVLILVLGLVYAWHNGHLDWIKSEQKPEEFKSPVPRQLYDKINERYKK